MLTPLGRHFKEPDACEWIGNQLKGNHKFVKRMVRQNGDSDPYWHLVGLFYKQMEDTKGVIRVKVRRLGSFYYFAFPKGAAAPGAD